MVLITLQTNAQDTINRKYLVALLHLKSDTAIINRMVSTFYPYETNRTSVEFIVHDEVWFHPLNTFRSFLEENDWGIDKSIISDKKVFEDKYYFEPHKMPLVSLLLPPTNSKLVLTFSKPVGNFLMAEMLDGRVNSTNTFKTGNAIEFLFIFDENGLIKKVFATSPVYR
jgi:hypothetical protein